jgi:nucleoside-diphosphate-sugar epimerase
VDTVDGFIRIAQATGALGQVINIGSGREISIGELAQLILGIMGKSMPVVDDSERARPQKSEVMRLACNADKARTVLGWSPRFPLEEGLARTVDWFRKHLSRYKTAIYNI